MRESSRLDLCNCFATRQAARHITRLYEKHLAEADVTSPQFSILVVLDEKRRASMSEMADPLVTARTTMLGAVKPLQLHGLALATRASGAGVTLHVSLSLLAACLMTL